MNRTLLERLFIQEMEPVVNEVIPYFNAASDLKFHEIIIIIQFGERTFEIAIDTFDESSLSVV